MNARKGFYPALGTPLDENGNLMEESFVLQIEKMIQAGAQGALCMGSMGAEAALTSETYAKTAKVAAETVNGRIPLFIGAMDNSTFRVKERLEMLKGLNFDGVVLTTPFYSTAPTAKLIQFFTECADIAPKPVYLYDLPGVTKQKITYPMMVELAKHPNIKGIKTGDIVLARQLHLYQPQVELLFSNLDIFDVAGAFGLPGVLDGMFTCVPATSAAFQKCYVQGDIAGAGKHLEAIIGLRDLFLENGIWPGYTIAMNLLGMEGNYGHGYQTHAPADGEVERIKQRLTEMGELK